MRYSARKLKLALTILWLAVATIRWPYADNSLKELIIPSNILGSFTNSDRSFTWAYKLKASNSSSQISATNWHKVSLIKSFQYMWWRIHRIVVSIVVLLPMQQFYITKMIMSIFCIIVTCPYIYSVCLVYQVLKNTYFKEYLSAVASKYYICDRENNT